MASVDMAAALKGNTKLAAAAAQDSPPLPRPPKRRKSVKVKKANKALSLFEGSPIERQLKETETWTKTEMHLFPHLPTSRERVEFIYSVLPDAATSLDRLWPIRIVQKDSRSWRDFEANHRKLIDELWHFILQFLAPKNMWNKYEWEISEIKYSKQKYLILKNISKGSWHRKIFLCLKEIHKIK